MRKVKEEKKVHIEALKNVEESNKEGLLGNKITKFRAIGWNFFSVRTNLTDDDLNNLDITLPTPLLYQSMTKEICNHSRERRNQFIGKNHVFFLQLKLEFFCTASAARIFFCCPQFFAVAVQISAGFCLISASASFGIFYCRKFCSLLLPFLCCFAASSFVRCGWFSAAICLHATPTANLCGFFFSCLCTVAAVSAAVFFNSLSSSSIAAPSP
ncbi:hypothetical protein M9H77_30452 [Catharanthus roseus]|uniref:Uncharacterized protein n=1 Tax=Catharanthus roseus TaxID=4058 RepID=A0ACB9ZYC4_CATRO|nr:hypothetical protein M9H77_30452 [Catharanthus roseus]